MYGLIEKYPQIVSDWMEENESNLVEIESEEEATTQFLRLTSNLHSCHNFFLKPHNFLVFVEWNCDPVLRFTTGDQQGRLADNFA